MRPSSLTTDPPSISPQQTSLRELAGVFGRVGLLSFGGPAAQIGLLHRVLVEERAWLDDARFSRGLNFCMLLPGPEAMQLATWAGWRLRGTAGGVLAGALFVLPGFASILALSLLYVTAIDAEPVQALLYGLKAGVVAVVAAAVVRLARRLLHNNLLIAIAAAAFVAIFFLQVPFPLIIIAAALAGWAAERRGRQHALVTGTAADATLPHDLPARPASQAGARHLAPSRRETGTRAAVWTAAWLAPVAVLGLLLGREHVLTAQAEFFSRMAVVTFGGAYSVLAYVAQHAVEVKGWLTPLQMLDGLGLAESTPGPLIQVVQFVGFLGAHADPGGLDPVVAGVVASMVVTWVTFMPSFLFVLTAAPYFDRLAGSRALASAMSAITAAVVGVVLNLATWFAIQTLFAAVQERQEGPVRLLVPTLASLDAAAAVITVAAFIALVRYQAPLLLTIGASVLAGGAWHLLA